MESEILELYLTSGDSARGKREASEWVDLKSRVQEDTFRKLSADLERRRARRFFYYAEEERKVIKELNNLQRDRLRFEREKQLRQRNSFSSSRERRRSLRTPMSEANTQLSTSQKSLGGSASLAFDPTFEKRLRPPRRSGKNQTGSYGTVRKTSKDLTATGSFPYFYEENVRKFHKSCKSAAKSECRRWGAAWFYAKKEQDIADDSNKRWRWTTLLLKTEKEKMRNLREKGVALLEFGLDRNPQSRNFGNDTRNTSKSARAENADKIPDNKGKNPRETALDYTGHNKLTFHKAFSLPHVIDRQQEGESPTDD